MNLPYGNNPLFHTCPPILTVQCPMDLRADIYLVFIYNTFQEELEDTYAI